MLKHIFYICITFSLTGCLNLDSFMFEPEKTDRYLLDDYTGDLQFQVPDSLSLPQNRIEQGSYNSEGNTIYYVLTRSADPRQDTTIFYCHGNNKNIDYFWPRIKLLAATGYNVFIFDYRGYGKSTGTPDEEGVYQDTRDGLRWLLGQGFPENKFVYYGYSMGSIAACEVAANFKEAVALCLILESPIASGEMLVQDGSALAFPGEYFTTLKMDNAEKIKTVTIPLLWLHGRQDDFVAMATHGETVYNNHPGPKEAVRVDHATHSNVPLAIGFDDYIFGIRQFIRNQSFD